MKSKAKFALTTQNSVLIGFLAAKFFLQFILIDPVYELHRDEYLHLDQGNHLAFGYISVPPVTAWISWVIKLLGGGVFWAKFFPALFGALTLYIVWQAVRSLGGGLFALVLAASCVLFSILLRLNTLYQPNSLDVLCWTALYFTLIKCIQHPERRWYMLSAIIFAIGFLNKYNIGFLLAGFVPALLITPQRNVLFNKNTLWATLLGLLLISPNLIWQYQNEFPVVWHMKELSRTQLVNVDRGEFLSMQLKFFAGGFPVLLAGLGALAFYNAFSRYRVFLFAFIFTLCVFMFFRAKDYYAIGLHPIYFAFGAVFLEAKSQVGWLKMGRLALLLLPILYFIRINDFAFPNKTPEYIASHQERYRELGMLRWEDGKNHKMPQDFADMLGWKELAQKTDSLYRKLSLSGKTLVLCDNYGQAGAINFYTKAHISAVTFNADYINWFDLSTPYRNLIRVKTIDTDRDELALTSPFFGRGWAFDSVTNRNAREYGTVIYAFEKARIDVRDRLRAEIEEERPH